MSRRLLLVDVMEAKNLIACVNNGTSNPYLSAKLLDLAQRDIKNEKFKSNVIEKSLKPNWNQRFTFGQNYDLNNVAALPTLCCEVFHKAGTFATDAPMGVVDIPLTDIPADGTAHVAWYPLKKAGPRMKDVSGEIRLTLKFTAPPPGMASSAVDEEKGEGGRGGVDIAIQLQGTIDPDHEDKEPNELQVVVIQGRDLLICDTPSLLSFGKGGPGSSDPFVTLSVKGMRDQKTKIIQKSLNPVWNESFSFGGVVDPALSLEVLVQDDDLTTPDFMGKLVISLEPLVDQKEVRKWYKLKNKQGMTDDVSRGEVELTLRWRFNPDFVVEKKRGFFGRMTSKIGLVDEDTEEEANDEDQGTEAAEPPISAEDAEKAAKEKAEAEAKLKSELGDIEIKSGDYQIQVHIIEARELKGKDVNGLSDPIVYIEMFGQTQNSSVKKASLNTIFDELFIFNFRNLDKDAFSEGIIRIKVMNANVIGKNDLIGVYQVDSQMVYFQKDHEQYRIWTGLMNDEDPEDTAVQGYLQLSIQVVGPGDKLKIHDVEEEMKIEREKAAKSGNDLGSMIVMPPTIKKEWKYLVTTIYKCQYLPLMDLNAIRDSGTDAFITVSFAGGKPQKTRVKTLKGERSAMNPVFNYEIWIPVSCPTASQTCKISVWDYDIGNNELIASCYSKFNVIDKLFSKNTGPYWVNLYGAPENAAFSLNNMVSGAIASIKTLGGMNYKDVYNNFPDKGSSYKGRLLMSQRIELKPDKKVKEGEEPADVEIEPFVRSIKKSKRLKANQEPPTRPYVLKTLIVSGTQMPQFIDKTNPLKKQKLQMRISCGQYELVTNRVECNKGVCEFNQLLTSEEMILPVVMDQVPDIMVHILRGKDKDIQQVAFARFKAKDVMAGNFMEPAKWIYFQEDKVIDALENGEFPGTVLMRLGFGTLEVAKDHDKEWNAALARLKTRIPYQLRVHIYQGADLPAADSNGLLDPYVKVNFLGFDMKKTVIRKKTRFPLYYTTITFDCELPDREFLPQCNLQLYDYDQADITGDDYMGQIFLNLQEAFILSNLSDPLPDPSWKEFFIEVPGDGQGSLLVSTQLVPKKTPDQQLPPCPDISPTLRQAYIEIIALGCRNLKPYQFQGMVSPYMELELECIDKKVKIETEASKRPSPNSPNFLQRLVMPVMLPDNAMFSTPMAITVRDVRLGGFNKPEVAVGTVDLVDKIPWSKTYKPPQTDVFFQNTMNMVEGFSAGGKDEVKDVKAPALDATAKEALALVEKRKENAQDDLVVTQEPLLSLEQLINRRINENDSGAGVFGALTHIEIPKFGGKHKKTAEDFFGEVNWDESDEIEPPKYMLNRKKLKGELEEELQTTPFETYLLSRGQKNAPFGSTYQIVGKFKGLVRVMLAENEAPLFDLDTLLKPTGYKLRLYVLAATNLTPMDMGFGGRPGKSDPYLKVSIGKDLFDDRENAVDDVTEVDLYKLVEFNIELPGFSQLQIEVMDKDDIGSDDLIGKTIIDLEDRWFDSRWQELGNENRVVPDDDATGARWDTKPLELRTLYVPSSNNGQGVIQCWVDMLTPAEANAFVPDDVALPPRQIFEVRIVIWKTRDVPAQDTLGGQNMTDLFIKVWPEGCDEQDTDTHWRSKKGKASFNWRMIFDVELGHNTRAMKFPKLNFQMWDKDIIKWNDCFADGSVDIGKYYRKAFKKGIAIKAFPTVKGGAVNRAATDKQRKTAYANAPIPDDKKDVVPPEDPPAQKEIDSNETKSAIHDRADSDDETEDAGIGVLGKMSKNEKKALINDANTTKAKADAIGTKDDAAKPPGGWFDGLFGSDADTPEEEPLVEDDTPKKKTEEEEDAAELDGFINSIKEMTGMWEIDPEDSTWLHLDRLDHETNTREPMGRICWSMQLWPKDKAKVMVVGSGRNEPNTDPYCPPPTGRLQFTLNPFVMAMQICGPSLCAKIMCCFICLGILALMIFCQPALNILIGIFLY